MHFPTIAAILFSTALPTLVSASPNVASSDLSGSGATTIAARDLAAALVATRGLSDDDFAVALDSLNDDELTKRGLGDWWKKLTGGGKKDWTPGHEGGRPLYKGSPYDRNTRPRNGKGRPRPKGPGGKRKM